jgi:hypothetical protein
MSQSLLVLDLSRRELRARGVSVPIGGRAFEILAILAQSAGELVLKDELMRGEFRISRVWSLYQDLRDTCAVATRQRVRCFDRGIYRASRGVSNGRRVWENDTPFFNSLAISR